MIKLKQNRNADDLVSAIEIVIKNLNYIREDLDLNTEQEKHFKESLLGLTSYIGSQEQFYSIKNDY